jgi:hypothetical protein
MPLDLVTTAGETKLHEERESRLAGEEQSRLGNGRWEEARGLQRPAFNPASKPTPEAHSRSPLALAPALGSMVNSAAAPACELWCRHGGRHRPGSERASIYVEKQVEVPHIDVAGSPTASR